MTDRERIDILDYMRERFDQQNTRFDHQDELLAGLAERMESLETDRDERRGRNKLVASTVKTIAGAAAFILTLLGIKSQTGS